MPTDQNRFCSPQTSKNRSSGQLRFSCPLGVEHFRQRHRGRSSDEPAPGPQLGLGMRPLRSSAEAQVNLNPGFERTLGCGLVRVATPRRADPRPEPTQARNHGCLKLPRWSRVDLPHHVPVPEAGVGRIPGPETARIWAQARPRWQFLRAGRPRPCGATPDCPPGGRPRDPAIRARGQRQLQAAARGQRRLGAEKTPGPTPGRPSRGRPTSLLVRVRDARLVRRPAGPARPGRAKVCLERATATCNCSGLWLHTISRA